MADNRTVEELLQAPTEGHFGGVTSQSAKKKQEFVKSDDKQVVKKADEKKRDVLSDSEASSSSADENMSEVLKDQLQVKHVVIDTHVECQEKYAKLEAVRYEYMIRYSAYFDNDKQHRKQIGVESSENVSSESENQTENDCLVVEKENEKEENPKVIAPGMFKLNVSQCVSPIS
nr:hypothetical protein [Tanacetum cinerariifolium]